MRFNRLSQDIHSLPVLIKAGPVTPHTGGARSTLVLPRVRDGWSANTSVGRYVPMINSLAGSRRWAMYDSHSNVETSLQCRSSRPALTLAGGEGGQDFRGLAQHPLTSRPLELPVERFSSVGSIRKGNCTNHEGAYRRNSSRVSSRLGPRQSWPAISNNGMNASPAPYCSMHCPCPSRKSGCPCPARGRCPRSWSCQSPARR